MESTGIFCLKKQNKKKTIGHRSVIHNVEFGLFQPSHHGDKKKIAELIINEDVDITCRPALDQR